MSGSIFAGILNKTDYKSSALQGVVIMLFPVIFYFLLAYTSVSPFFGYDYSYDLISFMVLLIVLGVSLLFLGLSALGSLLGTFIQMKLNITKNKWWIKINERLNQIEPSQWKISYLTFVLTLILLSIWSLVG